MLTAPIETAGLVTREVRNGTRDGNATKVAVARRTYPTDRADLWDAVTNPERLPRWFAPVHGDLRPGGRYDIEGNASGVIEECEEPVSFSLTWEFDTQVSWVTVTLTPTGEVTTLELVHEAPVDPDFWARFGPGAVGVGWDLALLGLGLHVDTGDEVDPEVASSLTFSPEGIAFVERAASGWAEGAIGAGDDAEQARAAAERTVAFYTTDPSAGTDGDG